jgi:hypothetical protein
VQRLEGCADLDKRRAAVRRVLHINSPDELQLEHGQE